MTSGAVPQVTMRPARLDDAAPLAAMAEIAFVDTFGAYNDPADMSDYVSRNFGESLQRAELADPAITVFLAEHESELAGYAMLREGSTSSHVPQRNAIEIARLYVAKRFIGLGIGALLMRRCLDEAEARAKDAVWLGVWGQNTRAIAFYERWGFAIVGTYPFMLGRDRQTDHAMSRPIGHPR